MPELTLTCLFLVNTKDKKGVTPFIVACYNGHKDVVKLLLDNSERIELNARVNDGWTAAMLACNNGHKDVVQLLLDQSKRIDLKTWVSVLVSVEIDRLKRRNRGFRWITK